MLYTIIVDDEPVSYNAIMKYISKKVPTYEVSGCFSKVNDAYAYLCSHHVDVVISDIRMPVVDGLEFSKMIHERFPDIQVILISGYSEFEYAKKAIKYGVVDYLLKPLDFDELFSSLMAIYQRRESSPNHKEPSCIDDARIKNAVEYIHLHYSEDLSRDLVAKEVSLSPSYFSMIFKEKTGMRFADYLTKVRMEKAAELLKKFISVENVSKSVGYRNRNRFNINFKEYWNCSPAEYRRSLSGQITEEK